MKIDKSMPILPSNKSSFKYPFPEMEIGDSIFVPIQKLNSARQSAFSYGKRSGKKFITREVDGGVRIWRIA